MYHHDIYIYILILITMIHLLEAKFYIDIEEVKSILN